MINHVYHSSSVTWLAVVSEGVTGQRGALQHAGLGFPQVSDWRASRTFVAVFCQSKYRTNTWREFVFLFVCLFSFFCHLDSCAWSCFFVCSGGRKMLLASQTGRIYLGWHQVLLWWNFNFLVSVFFVSELTKHQWNRDPEGYGNSTSKEHTGSMKLHKSDHKYVCGRNRWPMLE